MKLSVIISNLVATYLLLIIENLRIVVLASKCSFIFFPEEKSRGIFECYFSCEGDRESLGSFLHENFWSGSLAKISSRQNLIKIVVPPN